MARLKGRRILVTRPRSQGTRLNEAIEEAGGEVLWIPAIDIVGAPLGDSSKEILKKLYEFDWVAFTSEAGARHFLDWMAQAGAGWPIRVRVASVGANTTRVLKAEGVRVDLQPETHTGQALGELLVREGRPGRALLPRGDQGREELAQILAAAGWEALPLICYLNSPAPITPKMIYALEQGLDAAVFASPSALKALWPALPETARDALRRCACLPIGPTTAQALRDVGIEPAAIPEAHTVEGVVATLLKVFEPRPQGSTHA